jgi:steroid delta-isomerase-like uncharacterized protein
MTGTCSCAAAGTEEHPPGGCRMIIASYHARGDKMDNAAALQRLYERLNAGDADGAVEVLADDFVEHELTPGLDPTKEGTKQLFRMMIAAFPDLRFDAEDILTSGDKVVSRSRFTGTNKGEFMGMPATGKSVNVQLIEIVRFGDDGLAYEHWGVMDIMSMMQQLGAVPQGPPV